MKPVIYFLLGCLLVLGWQLLRGPEPTDVVEAGTESPKGGTAGLDDKTRARLRFVEGEIERLTAEVATIRVHASRATLPDRSDGPTPRKPGRGTGSSPDLGPQRYLTLYVRSFASKPKGSEYFRLAVDAWAIELVSQIARLLRDMNQPVALRLQLARMLGTVRFRGVPIAIQALLDAARLGPESLSVFALGGVRNIGSASTIEAIESLFPGFGSKARGAALQTITVLAGPDANKVLLRLLRSAPDTATRNLVLAHIKNADPVTAVQILREAFVHQVPERTAAAKRLGRLFGEPFERLVDERLRIESDPGVRSLLQQAKQRMNTVPPHHPRQATGAPNAQANRDDHKAWATALPDAGPEWLEVGFGKPMRATSIRIHENHAAGAVKQVVAIDTRGRRHTLFQGNDPTRQSGVFVVPMRPTEFKIRRVRIVLDTTRIPSWNEIDAVQLIGPDGQAWAKSATASSYYGSSRRW